MTSYDPQNYRKSPQPYLPDQYTTHGNTRPGPPTGWNAPPEQRPYPQQMQPRSRSSHQRNNRQIGTVIAFGISILAMAVLVVTIVVLLNHDKTNTNNLQVVSQPASAAQVASQFGCNGFKDAGPSKSGGSIDSGTCTKDGVKYAINTFPESAVRDSWLKTAEQLGVNPVEKSDTAVVYKSVSSR